MLEYNIIHILTTPILIFSINKLMNTFFIDGAINKKIELITYLVYALATSIMIFITRIPIILLIFNICFLLIISFNYTFDVEKNIISVILIYSFVLVIEVLISYYLGFYVILLNSTSDFTSIIGLVLIRITIMIFSYLINKYKLLHKKDYEIPKTYYFGMIIILFGTLYLFVNSLDNTNLTLNKLLISSFILIVVNGTIINIDEKIYKSLILNSEQMVLKEQNLAYENQAKLSEEANNTIKSLKHDIKDHLIMIDEIYKKKNNYDEINRYISTIVDDISNNKLSNSNNFIFDSIINLKLKKIIDEDIEIKLDINIPPAINILSYDVTIIIGNLLDNAITGVASSNNKKVIMISINQSMGSLLIVVENTYNHNLICDGNILKTTKTSKGNHGLGLKNIKNSVDRYDGEMEIDYDNNIFSVSILIPYK